MPRTIRNEFDKKLSYENLMKAHYLSRKGKGLGTFPSAQHSNIVSGIIFYGIYSV